MDGWKYIREVEVLITATLNLSSLNTDTYRHFLIILSFVIF